MTTLAVAPGVLYGADGDDVLKSADGGLSWTRVSAGLVTGASRQVSAISIDPAAPDHLVIGTAAGIFSTTTAAQ